MREREGLIARIRQIRRAGEGSAPAPSAPAPPRAAPNDDAAEVRALRARVEHVERLVEALQDSVHRESERQSRRIAELEAAVQPSALTVALSKDARERGL